MDSLQPALLLQTERVIAAAWPADETVDIGGWLWRCSGGGFGRANSVATLGGPPPDIDAALADIEERYRAVGLPTLVQVTDASWPADLGSRLAARGYVVADVNATLTLDLAAVESAGLRPADGIEIADDATDEWITTYGHVLSPLRLASAPRILARVPRPRRLIGVRRDGQLVATVLLVVTGPIAVVECVATVASARRTGAARLAMETAISEAHRLGATTLALAMMAANVPARALYAGLGFVEVGHNRYYQRSINGSA